MRFESVSFGAPGELAQVDCMGVSSTTVGATANADTSAPAWGIIGKSKISPDCLECIWPAQAQRLHRV